MAAAGVSPSSSPRLPSPPPFTEVQIGPKSPSVGESFGKDGENFLGASLGADDGSTRRIRPGTKAIDMAAGPPLVPLSQLDSPFQLQEHLKALYNYFTRPEGTDTVVAITLEAAVELAEPPEGIDRSLWLYELCRFLTMKVNNLLVAFFAEDPPCSAQTCPEMRASEWQYLCAVHDPPKSCCAIDYCCHTLDWATTILTSPKYFPSRLTLGSEAGGGPQASMRHLTNIFRRLYRIFAHAWFQHREVFWQVEGSDGLYIFFKTVCDMYSLIPEDNYTVPKEAEGEDALHHAPVPPMSPEMDGRRLTILRKDSGASAVEAMEPSSISTGATTRRHKGSPSTSSRVTTINEGAEDDEHPKKQAPDMATAAAVAAVVAAADPVTAQEPKSPEEDDDVECDAVSEQSNSETTGSTEPSKQSVDSTGSQITVAEVAADEEASKAPEETEKTEEEHESTKAEPVPAESTASEDKDTTSPVEPSQPEPEPKPEEPKPESVGETETESKPELKPESKPETEAETETETKPETEPETKEAEQPTPAQEPTTPEPTKET